MTVTVLDTRWIMISHIKMLLRWPPPTVQIILIPPRPCGGDVAACCLPVLWRLSKVSGLLRYCLCNQYCSHTPLLGHRSYVYIPWWQQFLASDVNQSRHAWPTCKREARLESCDTLAGNLSAGCIPRCGLGVWMFGTGICWIAAVHVLLTAKQNE